MSADFRFRSITGEIIGDAPSSQAPAPAFDLEAELRAMFANPSNFSQYVSAESRIRSYVAALEAENTRLRQLALATIGTASRRVRMCCNCRLEIHGAAYESGGVYWHTYSCLNTARATPPEEPAE